MLVLGDLDKILAPKPPWLLPLAVQPGVWVITRVESRRVELKESVEANETFGIIGAGRIRKETLLLGF